MATFRHTLISGVLWIIIAVAVGMLGISLTDNGGLVTIVGWLIAVGAFGFAGLSLNMIVKGTSLQWKATKMMQDDPEGFAELVQEYERVTGESSIVSPGGQERNEMLAMWASTVPVSESQLEAMWRLWQAAQAQTPPKIDPLEQLKQDDRDYILQICSINFRPAEFGDANVLRLSSLRHFREIGFTMEQCAVIVGMMFNMIGRRDLY